MKDTKDSFRIVRYAFLALWVFANPSVADPLPVYAEDISDQVDLSFLNHRPAGQHGAVIARGEDLVFEDGTPVRFWGINLQAYALFRTEPDAVREHARRLARLGFNLVRIHHHDSTWVRPNIFGQARFGTSTPDPDALAKLDWWIKCLRDEGIYVWLDLHVGRMLSADDDVADFAETTRGKETGRIRGYNYVNDDIAKRMSEFNLAYLSHINPHTGLAYADDPAIAAILISNENDLTHHFGNALLPNKNVPAHSARYMEKAEEFAKLHGLEPNKIWKAWEYGPSKLFLGDLEQQFFGSMIKEIRTLGFRGLIATTNFWGGMSMAGLPSLTSGDIIDVHSYGDPEEIFRDPAIEADMFSRIASAHVAGMPLSVSEWNVTPFPVQDRFVVPLRLAALSGLQGWDALMAYGYAQQPLSPAMRPSPWDMAVDPTILAMMPAAALLYRQGHVAPARNSYVLQPDAQQLFGNQMTADLVASVRTLTERSKVSVTLPMVPELPWLKPGPIEPSSEIITDVGRSFMPGEPKIVSDTGEIVRDSIQGVFRVNSERSQIVAGWVGTDILKQGPITFQSENGLVALAVQSLDPHPIRHSQDILVSLAVPSAPLEERKLPFVSEPITATLQIAASMHLKPDPNSAILSHEFADGIHTIRLGGVAGYVFLSLRAEP